MEKMMMMMGYYGNTWVAMLKLITKVPICVNGSTLKMALRNANGSVVDQYNTLMRAEVLIGYL